jgi:hypothetical protein
MLLFSYIVISFENVYLAETNSLILAKYFSNQVVL